MSNGLTLSDTPSPAAINAIAPRVALWFGIAAALVCLGFAAYTGHMWEDYLITFRASENLASGRGLVFQPGERVHSFTSPLGTLLPALFALGGGQNVAAHALWALRGVSAFAVGVAVWLAIGMFRRDGLARSAIAAAGAALVLDPKIVDFSINGMETGLVVLFVTLTWRAFASGARVLPCALGFAGLQWTRPDGCVNFAAIAAAWLLLGTPGRKFAWPRVSLVLRSVVLGGILYLPWFLFAWFYYGSPVPHTILAKAQHHSLSETAALLARYPWQLLFGHVSLHDVFMPAYYFFGGWPQWIEWPTRILAVGAALTWTWPRVVRAGRIASGAFFLGGFYVAYIPPFPWYYPGWQVLGWITWAYLLHALWTLRPRSIWTAEFMHGFSRIAAALIIGLQTALLGCVAWQMRAQQRLIENGHRREIGRWLAETAAPKDTVFVECLGYIGYYSGLKMLDFPGLCAPEVVAARRAGHSSFGAVVGALRPDWVVVRGYDDAQLHIERPDFGQTYKLVRAFNTRRALDEITLLPGRGYLNFDAVFFVYHRIARAEPRQ